MRKKREAWTAGAVVTLGRDPARGEAFWWLYDNYADIKRNTLGKRIAWHFLASECAKHGLRDAGGNPNPTARTLRKTFARVEAMKRREAEVAAKHATAGKPVAKPGPPPIARPADADSWRRPQPAVFADPSTSGPTGEHPLMKRLRERSGG